MKPSSIAIAILTPMGVSLFLRGLMDGDKMLIAIGGALFSSAITLCIFSSKKTTDS